MASLVSSWASQVNTVPERYVVPTEKRLNVNVPIGKDIPVIDLSHPNSAHIAEQIIKASQDYGVFQVINHGVSKELIGDVLKVCDEFFKLPIEDLEKYTEEEELSEFEPNLDQKPKLYIEKEYKPKKNGKNDKEVIFWKDTFAHCTHPTKEERINSWPEKPAQYSTEDVSNVDVISAKDLLSSGHTYLDVRTVEEYNRGHIDKAINIPYMFLNEQGRVKNPDFLEQVSSLCQKEDHLIVGCNSGGRGLRACVDLLNAGYKDVRNLEGGYSAWLDNEFKGDEAAQQFKTACKFRP